MHANPLIKTRHHYINNTCHIVFDHTKLTSCSWSAVVLVRGALLSIITGLYYCTGVLECTNGMDYWNGLLGLTFFALKIIILWPIMRFS